MKNSKILFLAVIVCAIGFFGLIRQVRAEAHCYPNPVGRCYSNCVNFSPYSDVGVYDIAGYFTKVGHVNSRGEVALDMNGFAPGVYFIAEKGGGNKTKLGVVPDASCFNPPMSTSLNFYQDSSKNPIPDTGVYQGSSIYFASEIKTFLNRYISSANFDFSNSTNAPIVSDPVYDEYSTSYNSNACFSPCNMGYPSCNAGYTETDRRELTGLCHCEHRITCSRLMDYQYKLISGYTSVIINTSGNKFTGNASATDSAGGAVSASAVIPVLPPPKEIKATGSASCSCDKTTGTVTTNLSINGTQGVDYAILRVGKMQAENLSARTSNYYIPGKNWIGSYIYDCVGGIVKSLNPISNIYPSSYKSYSVLQDSKPFLNLSSSWTIPIGTYANSTYCMGGGWLKICGISCPSFTVLPSSGSSPHSYSISRWSDPITTASSQTGSSYVDASISPSTDYSYIIKVPATDRAGFTTTYSDPITVSAPACAVVPVCGDNACNGTETCSTCPQDCGACPVSESPSCVSFAASPLTVNAGGTSTLSWNCSNVTACTIDGMAVSGTTKTVTLGESSHKYVLSCVNGNSAPTVLERTIYVIDIGEVKP
ncbi:MAG: hypothetical protein PHP03_01390 [Candidatus Pacebacteria bacterium]|nr:hypothetical protein [Candidatus Paceibacterota bacterium]